MAVNAFQQQSPQTYTYIYILDAVPPVHVVSKQVATDKLTTANGAEAEGLRRALPVSVANHVKARQSPIARAGT